MAATRDPARTRAALLDAALLCFAERGYEGTSIRDIATRAGLSLGLLYHYFPSKEALLGELFARSVALIQGVFAEAADEPDPRRRLRRLIAASVRVMAEQRTFYRVSYGVRMQPAVLGALGEGIGAWNAALAAQFEALLTEAGFQDPATHAHLLIATLDGVCQHAALDPEHYPLDAVGALLTGLLGECRA